MRRSAPRLIVPVLLAGAVAASVLSAGPLPAAEAATPSPAPRPTATSRPGATVNPRATKPPAAAAASSSAAKKAAKAAAKRSAKKAAVGVAVPEQPPPDAVCTYHNPQLAKLYLQGAQLTDLGWPQARLGYERVHRITTGAGQTVAVVDSGVDAGQEHLRGRVLPGVDVTTGKAKPGATVDCASHGTRVAGVLAGGKVPGRSFVGVAPGVRILPVRESWGLDERGSELKGSVPHLLQALRLAVTLPGVRVVNVSVTVYEAAMTPAQQQAFAQVARVALARDVLIVAATGNRTNAPATVLDPAGPTYPAKLAATYPNVLAVAGIVSDGTPDENAITGGFVSLAAPSQGLPCPMDHGRLVACEGTSFAAPFVSGTAALVRARYPKLTAAQVADRLKATAVRPAADLPDPAVGYGVVDPVAAVTAALPTTPARPSAGVAAPPFTPPASRRPLQVLTMTVVGLAAGATLLVVGGLFVVRGGRRRGWRPGIRTPIAVARTEADAPREPHPV